MMLDGLYQEIILDHYKNPHGRGLRDPFDGEAHHVNPTCGDEITVRVSEDLSEISYDGLGCSISQASASVLHELVQGQELGRASEIHHAFVELMQSRGQVEPDEEVLGDGIAFAGVAKFPARVKCALLPWMAFKDAAARAGVDVGVSPEVKA
ncbi:Fe-S cluster assembly sulfur transfer protein SufU [Actinoplanes couchii]|uniref:Iron-sulfur cluster assembly scaffold protein NifU n=1 Tax=Actinoplanes couchii TaxID=403638 RepID=A0ABQ3X2M0_9ACTN|nr:SUF system NifU family Fe-S cluster assembly protein [Actinoplanes couchii]MDR6322486.1 nitrogen fixation NifU-like protein [Actinoplanes couchii]GID52718.1 iron-sulfur cluster assembly scaffold protein NifU [Actinoplanes couchii]